MGDQAAAAVFAPAIVSSAALFFLFAYLWYTYRETYLGFWTAAWGLWLIRRTWALLAQTAGLDDPGMLLRLLAMSYVSLALCGSAGYSGRKVGWPWWTLAGVAIALPAVFPNADPVLGLPALVFVAVLGTGWCWAGIHFLQLGPSQGGERFIPASAQILMAIHTWTIPVLGTVAWLVPWRISVTLALQIGIAMGVMVMFHRQARDRAAAAHLALESALTRALDGYLPVCAGCKSVRDADERWQPLEVYLSHRTEASVTHGICPDCLGKLYPDL